MKRLVLILSISLSILTASAQKPATGFPMYGSFDSQSTAQVNLQNLNYHLSVPITGTPGRRLPLNFGLSYDSSIWTIAGAAWTPRTDQTLIPTWGWNDFNVVGQLGYTESHEHCAGDPHGLNLGSEDFSNFTFVTPDGTVHSFNLTFKVAGDDCGTSSGTTTGYATDNSGYFLDGLRLAVWDRAGTISDGNSRLEDTNGNLILGTPNSSNPSEMDWTDTVGRIGLKATPGTFPTYQYLDSSGVYQTVSVTNEILNIKTAFGCSGIVEYTGTASVPQDIKLPNVAANRHPGQMGYSHSPLQEIRDEEFSLRADSGKEGEGQVAHAAACATSEWQR